MVSRTVTCYVLATHPIVERISNTWLVIKNWRSWFRRPARPRPRSARAEPCARGAAPMSADRCARLPRFSYKTNVSHIKGTSFHPTTYHLECPLICQHNIFSTRLACNISCPRVAVCRSTSGCVKLFSFMSQDTALIWTFSFKNHASWWLYVVIVPHPVETSRGESCRRAHAALAST